MNIIKKIPFEIYLVLIWGLSILIINPLGNFPLNDDWAYAQSVLNLYEHGKLTINSWPAMTLVGQIFWGTLFCKIFGFSFVVLRFSTLIACLIASITFYKIALWFSSDKKTAAFATVVIFFNPLFLSLSFTFMTDVHFFSFLLLSIYCFIKYLDKRKFIFIVLATVFTVFATMIRQPGVLMPLSFALVIFYKNRNIKSFLKALIPFIITMIFLAAHSYWLHHYVRSAQNVAGISALAKSASSMDFYQVITRLGKSLLYSGLFLAPLIVLFGKEIANRFKITKLKTIIFVVLCGLFLLIGGVHYPGINIFYNLGLGPKLLKDNYWHHNISPQLNYEVWANFIKITSLIASIFMLLVFPFKEILPKQKSHDNNEEAADLAKKFLLIFISGYMALLIISTYFFDRYTIPLSGAIALLLLSGKINFSGIQKITALAFLAIMMIFSIGATHDYLSWNRSRWQALEKLTQDMKISPSDIDGGFEFNAWYNTGPMNPEKKEGKSWWFVNNDEYVVSFGNIDGYRKNKAFYYPQILSFRNDSIYILKREENITLSKNILIE